jgi:hypothetical protein
VSDFQWSVRHYADVSTKLMFGNRYAISQDQLVHSRQCVGRV